MNRFLNFLMLFSISLIAWVRTQHNNGSNETNGALAVMEKVIEAEVKIVHLLDNKLPDEMDIVKLYTAMANYEHDQQTCQLCQNVVTIGQKSIRTKKILTDLGEKICKRINSNTVSQNVCNGLVDRLAEQVVYIWQNTKLDAGEVCAMLLNPDCLTHLGRNMTNNVIWELPLPSKQTFKPMSTDNKPMESLHMSDPHIDLFYTPGTPSKCIEHLCCRPTSHKSGEGLAEYWGNQEGVCDTPLYSVDKYMDQLSHRHTDLDFIVLSGDHLAHDVFNTSRAVTLEAIKAMSQSLKKFGKTTILPCLGNHDSHPADQYVPSDVPKEANISMQWLYNTLADDYWSQWLSTESKITFKRGGYYSRLVKDNLKAIVLNTNVCALENYWIAYNSGDIDGQLQWLIDELHDSEAKGVNAFLVGHELPSDCHQSWFNNFMRIVERYSSVIVANYFGHTHKEEFYVYYQKDAKTGRTYPLTHLYIGGSITSIYGLNPSYKIYELDHNGRPQDFTTYYTDLSASNARGKDKDPVWQTLYSAKSEYGLKDLSTESWDQLITRAKSDDTLTRLYYKNYHRNSAAYVRSNGDDISTIRRDIQNKRITNN